MKPIKRKFAPSLILLIFLSAAQLSSAFYDPSLGRWLNRDPGTERGFQTVSRQTINQRGGHEDLFTFVRNDPVGHGDKWGLKCYLMSNGMVYDSDKDQAVFWSSDPVATQKFIDKCNTPWWAILCFWASAPSPPPSRSPEEEEARKECVRRCHEEYEDPHELSFCIRKCNGGWNSPPGRPTPPGPTR